MAMTLFLLQARAAIDEAPQLTRMALGIARRAPDRLLAELATAAGGIMEWATGGCPMHDRSPGSVVNGQLILVECR
jgi:hypothetical protein